MGGRGTPYGCGEIKKTEFPNGLPWYVEWTKTCGLPLLFNFEPHPYVPFHCNETANTKDSTEVISTLLHMISEVIFVSWCQVMCPHSEHCLARNCGLGTPTLPLGFDGLGWCIRILRHMGIPDVASCSILELPSMAPFSTQASDFLSTKPPSNPWGNRWLLKKKRMVERNGRGINP